MNANGFGLIETLLSLTLLTTLATSIFVGTIGLQNALQRSSANRVLLEQAHHNLLSVASLPSGNITVISERINHRELQRIILQ